MPNKKLIDTFDRKITYLRISMTDQCNLRCLYCQPQSPDKKLSCQELLSYEEVFRVIRLAVDLGVKKVRLTGGEPLVRKDIVEFIAKVASLSEIEDLRLTTNGVLLDAMAAQLKEAGVTKLNISLDSLKRERFKAITGRDMFDQVWAGINRAEQVGFEQIKLNIVAMKGVNDDEFADFAQLTKTNPFQIRFIEFMPIGSQSEWEEGKYISAEKIKKNISHLGELLPVNTGRLDGPARMFKIDGYRGQIGFISPLSHKFCETCNRLRLTSEGKLRSCLLTDKETEIKDVLRSGCSDEKIKELLIQTIQNKPKGHNISLENKGSCHGEMSRIGG